MSEGQVVRAYTCDQHWPILQTELRAVRFEQAKQQVLAAAEEVLELLRERAEERRRERRERPTGLILPGGAA